MRIPRPKFGFGFGKPKPVSNVVTKSEFTDDIVVWRDSDFTPDRYTIYGGKDSSFTKFIRAFFERHGIGGKKPKVTPLDYDMCEAQRAEMHSGAVARWKAHPPRPNTNSETDIRNFKRDPKPEIVPVAHLAWEMFDETT